MRCSVEFRRSVHERKLVFFIQTHGHAEIILPEEENIDSGNRSNFRYVLDAVCGFYLKGDDAVGVPVSCVTEESGFVHAALGKIDRSRACSGISCAAHRLLRFGSGVDVGNEHAVGAEVEGLLNAAAIVIALYANQGFRTTACDSAQHRGEFFKTHWAMLRVHQQPVVTAVR